MRPLVLCLLGGCGFQSTIVQDSGTPVIDGTAGDAARDAAPDCFAQWRDGRLMLSTPMRLSTLVTAGDDRDPWVSRDRLTMYFTSDRFGRRQIFQTTRRLVTEAFGPPTPIDNLNVSGKDQEHAALSGDERTLILASNRGGPRFELFITDRPDTTTVFGSPDQRHLGNINAGNADSRDPFLSVDGRTLYFTRNPAGASDPRIAIATRQDTSGDFSGPIELGGINAGGKITADPALALDDRVLVFSSDRDGGRGDLDLWYATRADALHEFSTPAVIPLINSGKDDADPMLSADGCELYFASSVEQDFNLYVSEVVH